MNIGRFNLEEDRKSSSGRRIFRPDPERSKQSYYHDLPRLFLLLFMLLAAILGYYVKEYKNNPIRVITRSWEKTLKHSFKASLEGSTVMRNTVLGVYRNRQRYTSEKGIILPGDASENSGILPPYKPPYDAKSALELLRYARDAVEYDREDMYGYGTRHFSGLISLPDDSESGTRIFEYWVNIRTLLTVRLIITHVERNLDIDKRGIPINKEMYINIRYYDWR